MINRLLCIALLFCSMFLYGQDEVEKTVKTAAILPFFDNQGNERAEINTIIAEELAGSFNICCQEQVLKSIKETSSFNKVYESVFSQDLKKVKQGDNLYAGLNETEMTEIFDRFGKATFLVIPKSNEKKSVNRSDEKYIEKTEESLLVFELLTGEFVTKVGSKQIIRSKVGERFASEPTRMLYEILNKQLVKNWKD
jgi:hypothetical protein